jgi:hypothetical protein
MDYGWVVVVVVVVAAVLLWVSTSKGGNWV